MFSPLLNQVISFFASRGETVSTFEAGLLTLVNPLMYVFLALPFGILADRKGWKLTVGIGAILMAVFCVLRIFALNMSFLWLLIFQIGFSFGGPPILASVQKMVVKWFPIKERTIASGLGILATFLGLMIGQFMSPILYADLGLGLSGTLVVDGFVIVLAAIIFFALARESPPKPPAPEEAVTARLGRMLRTRDLYFLSVGFFVGFGVYFSLTAWAVPILGSIGIIGAFNAGLVTGCMTLGGILGCVAIPRISDKIGRRKPFLILAGLFAAIFSFIIGTVGDLSISIISALLLGFFVIAVMPIALTMLGEMETVGATLVGAASGLAMTIGYIGAVGISLVAQMLSTPVSWYTSILLLAILGVVGTLVMALVRETGEAVKKGK